MRLTRVALIVTVIWLCSCSLLPGAKKGQGGDAKGGGGAGGGAPSGPPPVSVIVAPVEMRDYAPAINLTGEVRAAQRATLAAEVGGKVTAIAARVGESHRKGAGPLIQINPADYQAQLAAAQSQWAEAEAALQQARNGARPEEIAEQQGRVDQAQAVLDQANDNLRRQQKLYDNGVIAQSELVAAQSQVDSAQGALDSQRQVLDRLKHGTRTEEVQAAQARVKAAQSAVDLAQLSLGKSSITPAFDAKVVTLMVEIGQSVGPGTPLVEVVSDAPGEGWFNLPEADAAKVHVGDSVELRSDALPNLTFTGHVVGVSAAADTTTRQFPVRVALNDKRLLPGMAVRGRILQGELKPTLMASQDAAYESKLGLIMYKMVPPPPDAPGGPGAMPALPTAEAVPVEVGERVDNLVVITKGELKPGDMVVTRGKEGIYPTAHIVPTNLMGKGGGGEGGGKPGAPAEGGTAPPAAGETAAPKPGEGAAPGGGSEATPTPGAGKKDQPAPGAEGQGGGK